MLLHGNGVNGGEWVIGRIVLALHNLGPVVAPHYQDGLFHLRPAPGGIETVCERMRPYVLSDRGRDDAPADVVIGHSMGGVILRDAMYVAGKNGLKVPRTCIAVSSPFRGSKLLEWLLKHGPAFIIRLRGLDREHYQNMLPGSPFLAKYPDDLTLHSFTGEIDALVRPSSALAFAKSATCIPCVGHYSIIASWRLWRQICALIVQEQ